MRVEITDGVGAPWPMTARGTPATEALLSALSMVIVKVEFHTGTTHIGTHRRVELGEPDVEALDKGEATEDAVSHALEQIAGHLHLLFEHTVDIGIVDSVEHIVAEHGLVDRILQAHVHQIVVAHNTLLRLHTVIGVKAQVLQINITGVEFHLSDCYYYI
mgnify:CR=1 FL=1